ncbi:MAG: PspC domain-containing protein [Bacteroidota bacterium]|nr:PspC domain-containing protein [Bacteroidota bacterium]
MKKNISINISSIIFHIEEDGYEVLKNYLESINSYFSKFEDKKEIVNDIENRIAEIFLGKTSPSKQVIALEDVLALISTMGTIADFAAIEDTGDPVHENVHDPTFSKPETVYVKTEKEQEYSEEQAKDEHSHEPKRLHRNISKKILGGVASGIASQFNIDPLWIRLFLIFLFFAAAFFEIEPLVAGTIIAYIILWVIVPASTTPEEENRRVRKLYRNPDTKVLGGVASGMAAFFGTDTVVFRLLFLMALFLGGTGFIVYIIFWIITPEARSITDKIQMQGDPVTLSNIENNVKKNSNPIEEKESFLTKFLLLPFRLVAIIFDGLIKLLAPFFHFVLDAIRIVLGISLITVGMTLLISLLMVTGYAIGLYNGEDYFFHSRFPAEFIIKNIPPHAIFFLFIALFVPALSIILTGFSTIRKENTVNSSVGWSLFGLWVLCMIMASATAPGWVSKFIHEGNYEHVERYSMNDKTLFLTVNEVGKSENNNLLIELIGFNGTDLKITRNFKARGKTREQAREIARNLDYQITKNDSILIFDSNIRSSGNDNIFIEEAFVTLHIPYNKPFVIDQKLGLLYFDWQPEFLEKQLGSMVLFNALIDL